MKQTICFQIKRSRLTCVCSFERTHFLHAHEAAKYERTPAKTPPTPIKASLRGSLLQDSVVASFAESAQQRQQKHNAMISSFFTVMITPQPWAFSQCVVENHQTREKMRPCVNTLCSLSTFCSLETRKIDVPPQPKLSLFLLQICSKYDPYTK